MMSVKKLKANKIYLGPINESHLSKLLKWMNDMDVTKYLTTSTMNLTDEAEKKWLKKVKEEPNYHYYGIFLNSSNELIGGISFEDTDLVQRTANLGIIIGEKQEWSKGYGTEAIKLMLDYGFNFLNLNNIMLCVYDFNGRAQRCYEKSGFKLVGKRRKSRYVAGKYYDEIYMDILAEDFKDSMLTKLI